MAIRRLGSLGSFYVPGFLLLFVNHIAHIDALDQLGNQPILLLLLCISCHRNRSACPARLAWAGGGSVKCNQWAFAPEGRPCRVTHDHEFARVFLGHVHGMCGRILFCAQARGRCQVGRGRGRGPCRHSWLRGGRECCWGFHLLIELFP
ncbi:hypothetical protein BCR44DRAFT_1435940 [Catenaria anguillulae PL171]|uniref:Uncharacterized protein n=1 Tax=Catenaria anguillulae PL171 TaxID=765915 RepID=A0A1Y2HJ06_9FUNG|nr:hypothetical protein BCR44DRAFT_1435940 [Catenaria anguillulae PL171]